MSNLSIPQTLIDLIAKINQKGTYQEALVSFKAKHNVFGTNINFLTPEKVLQTYSIIKKKFYYERKNPANCSWFENELRIFICVLVFYLYIHQKDILSMTNSDWTFFKPIFYNRDPMIFEFQGILLLKSKTSKWDEQQIKLLDKIVKIKSLKNKWNSIARELYILSQKKYIKTPKQCRQRWLNYLDPSKVHSPWTNQQDYILLTSIRDNGKRWAYTVKKLLKKRTEHMVKNRFNSLINNQRKRIGNKHEPDLLTSAIETAKSQTEEQIKIKISQLQKPIKTQHLEIQNEDYLPSIFKKKSSKGKQKFKNSRLTKNINKINSLTTIQSFPTQVFHQNQILAPAEINKCKIQGQVEVHQFFQINESVQGFNPFEEYSHNNQFSIPNFLYYSQFSNNSDSHGKVYDNLSGRRQSQSFEQDYQFS